MQRKTVIHQLDTPYSTVAWPHVPHDHQDVILELLLTVLSPLGQYRAYIPRSKGKRERRRKRKSRSRGDDRPESSSERPPPLPEPAPVPPVPELAAHVDVGLASISRRLQEMSARRPSVAAAGGSGPAEAGGGGGGGGEQDDKTPAASPVAAVFVCRSGQASAFHCHFPQMVAVASRTLQPGHAVRLVGFSSACEDRLSACLGIGRVSSVAIRADAPGAKPLLDYVRDNVPAAEAEWLHEAAAGRFLETKINAVETRIGPKGKKRKVAEE